MNILKKRLPALILVLVFMLSISAVSLAVNEVVISAGKASGKTGDTVTLPISLADNPGISGMSLTISYDQDALALTDAECTVEGNFSPNLSAGVVTWLLGRNKYENGEYFSLSFEIKSAAAAGSYPISLSLTDDTGDNIVNENATPIPVRFQAGEITVESSGGTGGGPSGGAVVQPVSGIVVTPLDPSTGATGEGKSNNDGSIDITVRDRLSNVVTSIPGGVRVMIPDVEDGQVVVQLNTQGEIIDLVEKSLVEDHTAYVLLPGTAKIKIIDNAMKFNDVTRSNWFCEYVDFVSSHELFIGTGDDLFSPYMNMSRAMLVTVLWRLEDRPQAKSVSSFEDVVRNGWYDQAVDWAAENGITLGYSDETFAPNDTSSFFEPHVDFQSCSYRPGFVRDGAGWTRDGFCQVHGRNGNCPCTRGHWW